MSNLIESEKIYKFIIKYRIIILILITICILIFSFYFYKLFHLIKNKDLSAYSRRRPSYLSTPQKILDKNEKVYSPHFKILNYFPPNSAKIFKDGIQFHLLNYNPNNFEYIISKKKYKNISSLLATFDLTRLTNYNFILTSFHLVNFSSGSKINCLETIGNKIFRSSTNFNPNDNFESENLTNLVNPTTGPFHLKIEFLYDDPRIIISVLQNEETGIIYEEKMNYHDLVSHMNNGYRLVSSFSLDSNHNFENNNLENLNVMWEINDIKIKGREISEKDLELI